MTARITMPALKLLSLLLYTTINLCHCINGGEMVNPYAMGSDYPWFVVFVRTSDCNALCGGSLVGPSTVLTAAHCFFDLPDAGVDDPSIRAVINYVGPVNTPDEPDNIKGECLLPHMYKIKSVRKPVYYQHRAGYDLATVTLDTDAGCPGIDTVRMAGLSYGLAGWVNRHWTLLGFGATAGEEGKPSAYLKRLDSPIKSVGTSDQYCNLNAPSGKRVASQVCVFELSQDEAGASGDSGGPWSFWDATLSERILGAVQSSGQVDDKGNSFGSLHSPAQFQDWILSTIIESDNCLPTIVNKSSFFVGYVSNASNQFCELGRCGACSDTVATDPDTIRRQQGPNVDGCMNMMTESQAPKLRR